MPDDSISATRKEIDSLPSYGDAESETAQEINATPSYGEPVNFDEAQARTTGQPDTFDEVKDKSIYEEKMEAFDTPYKNEIFNKLGDIGGGYHAESQGGTVIGRGLIGATKAAVKPALLITRVAEELMGSDINDPDSYSGLVGGFLSDLNKLRDRGMVRQGIGGKIDIAGNAAELAVPLGVMAKANIISRISKKIPAFGKEVTKRPVTTAAVSSSAVGTGFGAQEYQPEEGKPYDWEEAKENAKTGAAIGFVAPPVVALGTKAVQATKRLIKHPFTSNPNKLIREVSDKKDTKGMDDIIDTMKDPKFESKVPGVKRTSGQRVAANKDINAPQIPAIEDLAEGVAPRAMWKAKQEQAAARLKEMHKLSKKSPSAVTQAEKVRTLFTDKLYKKAENSTANVDTKPVMYEVNELLGKHGNENIAKPLREILKAITPKRITVNERTQSKGIKTALGLKENLTKTIKEKKITVTEMASQSRGIIEMMQAETVTGKALHDNAVLSQVKKALDKQIGLASPEYTKATALYKKFSAPVDQIKAGKKLLAKLTDANEVEKRGASFATEINKMKTDRAYGKARWDALTKKQQQSMENILADLHVNAEYAIQSKAALSSAGTDAASKGIGPIGAFKPLLSALRSRIDSKMGEITRRGMKELSTIMQNPEAQAEMLSKGTVAQKAAMYKILNKWATTPGLIFGIKQESTEDK